MPSTSRRGALRVGSGLLLAGLAGCSKWASSEPATLDRLVLRADTGRTEPIGVRRVYAARDDSTVQSYAVYDAPASDDVRIVEVDREPGFYAFYAEAQNYGSTAAVAFNSHADSATFGDVQFEFVVKRNGTLWANVNGSGETVSIPGYER